MLFPKLLQKVILNYSKTIGKTKRLTVFFLTEHIYNTLF